jgi:hypothetical protein
MELVSHNHEAAIIQIPVTDLIHLTIAGYQLRTLGSQGGLENTDWWPVFSPLATHAPGFAAILSRILGDGLETLEANIGHPGMQETYRSIAEILAQLDELQSEGNENDEIEP